MQDHRSLSILIMNQKMTSEMFELNKIIAEEQSDKFNIYKDSVKDIISEMSDNAESSSDWNDNSSVSKKTHMRLEIARLQHEIEEEILLTAEQSETDDILEDNSLDENVTMNMQHF
ncbi:hypothetical protein BDBG_16815 [Blastomyces gilchristii SLH14081]|uniref:Uncharacterized protein n=1 Tax=Blastomyces gilchristii (strain SLH14081) TaxID=559298 RepID=A0A179UGZ3_BLAGS|nr:uncharacterized protein BDBG_16815 [Blastomyces gilchristii SLH14081]OAT07315.1 hypothetical protein BDBG_16815 [Blastomyces gilchristii SLH14081]